MEKTAKTRHARLLGKLVISYSVDFGDIIVDSDIPENFQFYTPNVKLKPEAVEKLKELLKTDSIFIAEHEHRIVSDMAYLAMVNS